MLGTAQAAVSLGTAVGVVPTVVGDLDGQRVTIIQGSDLFEGQTITTAAAGEVQIVFVDDTRMVIGPNSSLVLERYLLRDPNSFSQLTLNALGGTFRFISGDSPSDAYSIRTPTGTIAVRGTALDIAIDWVTRIADVMVLEGNVFVCPDNAECIVLTEQCQIGTIQAVTEANIVNVEATRAEIAQARFPYAVSQWGLLQQFRVRNSEECAEVRAELVEIVQPPPQPPTTPPPPGPPPPEEPPPPPPTPPPPPPEEPPVEACQNNNNGIGNGGECDDEGPDEGNNPGNANNAGGNGNNGNHPNNAGGNGNNAGGNGNGNANGLNKDKAGAK